MLSKDLLITSKRVKEAIGVLTELDAKLTKEEEVSTQEVVNSLSSVLYPLSRLSSQIVHQYRDVSE